MDNAFEKMSIQNVLDQALEITKDIVADIMCDYDDLFRDVAVHDPFHKLNLIQKIVFAYISIRGKHLCRTTNVEEKAMIRHKKTKEILFCHE